MAGQAASFITINAYSLSSRPGLGSRNRQDVIATVQMGAPSSRCSEPASVSEEFGGDIQQEAQPVQLATAKVVNKEGPRNSQRPEEIRETGGLNAIWCAGLDQNTGHLRKN